MYMKEMQMKTADEKRDAMMCTEDGHLWLREAREEDTPLIVTWRNNPEVMRFFFYRTPFTEEGHKAWRKEHIATGACKQFMVCVSDRDTEDHMSHPIGLCTIQHITKDHAGYGYLIGEDDMRGRGYGTETTRLACAYAKDVLHLTYLTAEVLAGNTASLRSFEKAGFFREREEERRIVPTCETVTAVCLRKDL